MNKKFFTLAAGLLLTSAFSANAATSVSLADSKKGDLSENYEYRAAKREQARLLGRIRYKQRVLEFARVIDKSKIHSDTVGLLCKVTITNIGNGKQMTYTLTSTSEANLREGKLSIKSPIAQALPACYERCGKG